MNDATRTGPEASRLPRLELVGRKGVPPLWSRSTALLFSVATLSIGNELVRFSVGGAVPFVAAVVFVLVSAGLAYSARWAPRGRAPRLVWFSACVVCAALLRLEPLSSVPAVIVLTLIVLALLVPRPFTPVLLAGAGVCIVLAVLDANTWGFSRIDVFTTIQGSTGSLIHGQDPYLPRWPGNVLTPGGPAVSHFNFVYGPSVLLLAAPGRVFGDVRLAGACMWFVIVASIVRMTLKSSGARVRTHLDLACLLVTFPLAPVMISSAWAEIYPLAAFTVWAVLRDRHRSFSILALGLCLSAKPTLGAIIFVAFLWWPGIRRDLMLGIGTALAVVAVFGAWDHRIAYLQAILGSPFNAVYYLNRPDALGLNAGLHALTGDWPSPFALLLVMLALVGPVLLTRPRDLSDVFALGAALTIAVVLCSRAAFLNYYFVAAVALFLALAHEESTHETPPMELFPPLHRLMMGIRWSGSRGLIATGRL